MSYTLYLNGVLEKDGFNISVHEENPEYQEYLAWLAQGNTPQLADGDIYLQKLADAKLHSKQVRQAYQNMLTRLQQIQNATNPTNAQVIQAVKDLALYQERILRVLAKII